MYFLADGFDQLGECLYEWFQAGPPEPPRGAA